MEKDVSFIFIVCFKELVKLYGVEVSFLFDDIVEYLFNKLFIQIIEMVMEVVEKIVVDMVFYLKLGSVRVVIIKVVWLMYEYLINDFKV